MSGNYLPIYGKDSGNNKQQNGKSINKNTVQKIKRNYIYISLIFFIILLLFFYILKTKDIDLQKSKQSKVEKLNFGNSSQSIKNNQVDNQYQYYLSVAAISRNDEHLLREFVYHYLSEGADHIYLGDNDSQDYKAYIYVLYDFLLSGKVDLYHTVGAFDQYEFYNYFILPVAKKTSRWLLVVDADEFMYAPQKDRTLAQNLRSMEKSNQGNIITQVCAPWIQFASDGIFNQPRCITQAYQWGSFENKNFSKCIVQPEHTYQLAIHAHIISSGITICSNGYVLEEYLMSDICGIGGCSITRPDVCYIRSKDNSTQEYAAITNHYQLQSLEYFQNVRMARADKQTKEWKAYWNMDRFKELNQQIGGEHHPELAEKNTVPFCFQYEELHVGLPKIRLESKAVNFKYNDEIRLIQYRSNKINIQIRELFYPFPDISQIAYNSTENKNMRVYNYGLS